MVAVVKDGQMVYQHSGGAASLEFGVPLSLSTVFLIASLSKQFTAFVIMLLESSREGGIAATTMALILPKLRPTAIMLGHSDIIALAPSDTLAAE